jgi:hypothetical protein
MAAVPHHFDLIRRIWGKNPGEVIMSTNPLDRGIRRRTLLKAGLALGALQFARPSMSRAAIDEKKYDPGATDKQVKIGNIMPYSGPASAYAVIGKTETAFFQMINDEGGIDGRKLSFISYDDGYSPPKTFEQARKLVEDDNVLLIFNSLGTPTNSAIHSYMNQEKVPQLFVATGATKWNNPKHFPWTMGWQIEHRLTKPNHPWTNGQVERMNRTLKEATVRRYHYETRRQLENHLGAFLDGYNFAKRLKTLHGLTPYEAICTAWANEPDRFRLDPVHLTSGLNT